MRNADRWLNNARLEEVATKGVLARAARNRPQKRVRALPGLPQCPANPHPWPGSFYSGINGRLRRDSRWRGVRDNLLPR